MKKIIYLFLAFFILSTKLYSYEIQIELSCKPINEMKQDGKYFANIECTQNGLIINNYTRETLSVESIDSDNNIVNFKYDNDETLSIHFYENFANILMTKFILCEINVITERYYDFNISLLNNK